MLLGGYQIIDLSHLGLLTTTEDNPDFIYVTSTENSNKNLYDLLKSYLNVDKICYLTGLKFKRYDEDIVYTVSGVCFKQEIGNAQGVDTGAESKTLGFIFRSAEIPKGVYISINYLESVVGGENVCELVITFNLENV